MPIFLHFLNREVYRAANVEYRPSLAHAALRTLAIGQDEPLYTNFSNVLEGGLLDRANSSPLARLLLAGGQLHIAGERPSLREFIESRAEMYFFDKDRYPMYFSGEHVEIDVVPAYIRQSSVTDFLSDEIQSLAHGEKGPRELGVAPIDVRVVAASADQLGRIVQERGTSAITRSLFETTLPTAHQVAATSRLISSLYIKRYLDDLKARIATGIPVLVIFDHLNGAYISSLDLPIIRALLRQCGFAAVLRGTDSASDEMVARLRGTPSHRAFTKLIKSLCDTLDKRFNFGEYSEYRASIDRLFAQSGAAEPSLRITPELYIEGGRASWRFVSALRRNDRAFAQAYEVVMAGNIAGKVILLVTATKVETRALTDALIAVTGIGPAFVAKDAYTARDFGIVNNQRLIHVQCEPGSVGQSSSQAVVTDAIRDFGAAAVIIVGIAFGLRPDKQQLGDVLVSKMVLSYEKVKLKEGESIGRGERPEASAKLLSLFRAAEAETRAPAVHVGTIVSGEKLVDDKDFVEELKSREPEAVGGEMEAAGLMSAANRLKADWILVKAIVDWGHNKEKNNDDAHQLTVARNAVNFVVFALTRVGL